MTALRDIRRSVLGMFAARLIRRFRASYLTMLAAALAYYAAFSLGPLLLLLGGWLGVLLQTRPDLAGRYRGILGDLVSQVMPLQENSSEVVARSFETIVTQLAEGALLRSVLSLLVLIWAASGFFTSLQLALEVIFEVSETRSFVRRRLVSLLLVIVVALVIGVEIVGGALLSSLSQVSELIGSRLPMPDVELPALIPDWLRTWFTRASTLVLRLALAALAFTLAFRFLPRRASSWTGALAGGAFSSVSIALTRALLVLTFDTDRFNVIYGVITSVVVTLLWLYLALLMFLVGALLTAEISAWRRNPPAGGPGGEARAAVE
jgi:membrane protein